MSLVDMSVNVLDRANTEAIGVTSSPLVSVIIPTFNRASVIGRAVENVLGQTYRNVEVIVVDDGSNDDTEAQLQAFGDRVILLKQENRGPSAARNRGIRQAKGEIVAFLDSDDLWLPNKLERQVALMERVGQRVPCCLCNATLRHEGGEERSFSVSLLHSTYEEGVWLNPAEVLASRFVFFNQAVAVRRWALTKAGGFDESLRHLEDWDLALRLAVLGPWAFIQEPLAIWNPNGSGSLVIEGRKNPMMLKQSALRLHRNAFEASKNLKHREMARELKRKLNSTERELRALRVEKMKFPGASSLSSMLKRTERIWQAIVRRTPLFPRMKTLAVPSQS